jgi:type VI protein secretion system component VasK
MTAITHSDCTNKGPRTARILLFVFGLILVVGWIGMTISQNENEERQQLQAQGKSLKSWQEYPKTMQVSRPATGYHYPYANQIQQVAQFAPGQAVTVVQKDGQWYQVRISGDRLCWVHQGNLATR